MIFILNSVFTVVTIAIIVLFSTHNQDTVTIAWSPFHEDVNVELGLICLFGLSLGFLCGCLMVWFNTWPIYFERYQNRKTIKKLQADIEKQSATAHKVSQDDHNLLMQTDNEQY